jgi:hypothetical protein
VLYLLNLSARLKFYRWRNKYHPHSNKIDELVRLLDKNIDDFAMIFARKYHDMFVGKELEHNTCGSKLMEQFQHAISWLSYTFPRCLRHYDTEIITIRDKIVSNLSEALPFLH